MSKGYWREHAAKVIRPILERHGFKIGDPMTKALKDELYDAYPFGVRQYHPYKQWLKEIRWQTLGRTTAKPKAKKPGQVGGAPADTDTLDLFE